jgi:hypothetical protein
LKGGTTGKLEDRGRAERVFLYPFSLLPPGFLAEVFSNMVDLPLASLLSVCPAHTRQSGSGIKIERKEGG